MALALSASRIDRSRSACIARPIASIIIVSSPRAGDPGDRVSFMSDSTAHTCQLLATIDPSAGGFRNDALVPWRYASTMARRSVITSGQGRASRAPDLAVIRVGIQLTRPSAATARGDAAEAMHQVVAAVLAAGIPTEDARTAQLSIGPAWDYPANKPPRVAGYQATNQLQVTVSRMDDIATVLDAAVGAGATTVDGIEFRMSPGLTAQASTEALAAAMADARARAAALAREAGLEVGAVRSIEESDPVGGGPRPMFARMEMAAAADTPVLAGTTDLEATVRVEFELTDPAKAI
jgi:uncharacterized protein YggE